MLQTRRDAAVVRRTKILSDIAAVESGSTPSKPVLIGEGKSDATQNHLIVLRKMLADEDAAIFVMNEDLARSGS
jgi:hypothetical protein